MRRKQGTALVKNEMRVLELLAQQSSPVHGYVVVKAFESESKVAMSTVYRCLSRLEAWEMLHGEWWSAEPDDRPVRRYTITDAGRTVVSDAAA